MKTRIFHIMMCALIAMASLQAWAETEPHDTVYFYNSWEQILSMSPEAMIIDPYIEVYTPYDIGIVTADEDLNELMLKEHVAATIGDSIWLVSSEYIKKNFSGDIIKQDSFMPLFFNDKVAYFMYAGYGSSSLSISEILFGAPDNDFVPEYYYLDFEKKKVHRVTPKTLIALLEDYHDLQMRYEVMKDYMKRPIIEDYFFKYIERASSDVMHPYILDVVGKK